MDGNLDLSAIIGKIMSDEALMNNIKSAVSGSIAGTAGQPGRQSPPPEEPAHSAPSGGIPENFAEQLPAILSALSSSKEDAAAANGNHDAKQEKNDVPPHQKSPDKSRENRKRLLNALKPYLSKNRCEAIDYLLSLSEITSLASVLLPNLQNLPNFKQGE